MDFNSVVSEFKVQWRYYVHYLTYALGKGMNTFIPSSFELNSTTTVLLQGWLWHLITHDG